MPPHAQAAIKAEALFRERGEPSRYRNRSWVEYVITVAGAQTRHPRRRMGRVDRPVARGLAADLILLDQ